MAAAKAAFMMIASRFARRPSELIGDRNGQLQALEGRTWDAVIDDSATNPEWVRLSTELLKGKAPQYLFTSSTGVYYPYPQAWSGRWIRRLEWPGLRTSRRELVDKGAWPPGFAVVRRQAWAHLV